MIFADWFQQRIDELNLSPADVSRKSGGVVKPNTITNWQKGSGKPSFDILPSLAKALDCTADDIVNLRKVHNEHILHEISRLPYYEYIEFQSGDGRYAFQECSASYIDIPEQDIRKIGADPKHVVFVKNTGKSNVGMIDENAPVAIDTSKKQIRDGHAYAVRHGELLRIKFLVTIHDGSVLLKSYNKDFEDDTVTKKEIEEGLFEVYGWACFWQTQQQWG